MGFLTTYEYQRNLDETTMNQRVKEADAYRTYWYERQSKRPKEELKAEVDRFMTYYETSGGFGLPISIVVAQEIIGE